MSHESIIFLLFLLGLVMGSFFNVVVYRLFTLAPVTGRSRCPECRRELLACDLIPLISYWQLGGKCRYCKKPIHPQYPLTEFFTGVVYFLVGWVNPMSLDLLVSFFIASILILVIVSDARYGLIFDWVIVPGTLALLMVKVSLGHSVTAMLLGALVGLIFFGLQYYLSDGKWIGFGDVKLGVFLGLAFGFVPTLYLIGLAYILGSVIGLAMLAGGRAKMKTALPLGVFLGTAGLYLLIWGTGPIERLLRL